MNAGITVSKLAELRSRTDRDLVRVIDHALELGLRSDVPPEKARAEVLKLLPAVEDLVERRRLERKLEHLEYELPQLAGLGAGI